MMGRNSLIKSIFRAKRFCFYINKYYFCTRIESEGAEKVKKIEREIKGRVATQHRTAWIFDRFFRLPEKSV